MKDSISVRQAGILLVLAIISNKVLLLPSLLFETSKTDGIFVMVVAFCVEIVLLPLFLWLKNKFPDMSFSQILKKYLTAWPAKIVLLLLALFMAIKALLTFSIVYVYFKQEIYQEEFLILILFCMLPVLTHGVISGLRPIARTIEFFFFAILTGFFVCLSLSLFTSISLPSFFVTSASTIFSSAFKYFIVFDDFIILFIIMDKIDMKKGKPKSLYLYALLGIAMVLMLFLFFYAKYPVTAFMHDNALSDLLVFSVQFSAIGRLDIVAMLTIMLMTLFQMEIYSFGFSKCFEEVFPVLNRKHAIVVFDLAFILIFTLFVGNHADVVEFAGGWFSYVAIAVAVIVLVFTLAACLIRRKHEKKD